MDVPARLWSGEGRRGGVPTSAGTDRRGTGQAVGEVRWDAGVHGQDFPPLAAAGVARDPFQIHRNLGLRSRDPMAKHTHGIRLRSCALAGAGSDAVRLQACMCVDACGGGGPAGPVPAQYLVHWPGPCCRGRFQMGGGEEPGRKCFQKKQTAVVEFI
jgi:hypothetical protein